MSRETYSQVRKEVDARTRRLALAEKFDKEVSTWSAKKLRGALAQPEKVAAAQAREDAAAAELAALRGKKAGNGRVILGVDPGTTATGVALLRDGKPTLLRVVHVRGARVEDRIEGMCRRTRHAIQGLVDTERIDTFVVEWQAIRPTDNRPNDILNLAIVLGAVMSVEFSPFTKIHCPLPVSWKGSVHGDVTVQRILGHFGEIDEGVWGDTLPSLQHNAVDALGLALWGVNRKLPWA